MAWQSVAERNTRALRASVAIFAAVAGLAVTGAGAGAVAAAASTLQVSAASSTALISPSDPNLQLEGRWDRSAAADTTVNSGSRLFLGFTGTQISVLLDTSSITNPAQFYARIDGKQPVRYVADQPRIELTPQPLGNGPHTLEIDVKDVDERANRWVPPLQSGFIVTGFSLAAGARTLPTATPSGPGMLFLGDSITQGVRAVGPQIGPVGSDATKDYAWLVGQAFQANFQQVGFGAQGITHGGNGGVPAATESLPDNFRGSPADPSFAPQAVIVNQGTNDGGASSQVFEPAYQGFLAEIRARWPQAWVFAMRPFNGAHAADIQAAAGAMQDPRVVYVDTAGWLGPDDYTDGLHPTVAGHLNAARKLQAVVAAHTGWAGKPIAAPMTELSAAGSAPGFESGSQSGWVPGQNVTGLAVSSATPANGAAPFDGQYALDTTSATAPLDQWRTVNLAPGGQFRLPPSARDLFAYVSIPSNTSGFYDVKITMIRSGRAITRTVYGIPNLGGSLPWDRVHLNLGPGGAPITRISLSVRGEGTSTPGQLSFQVDDIGWSDRTDG